MSEQTTPEVQEQPQAPSLSIQDLLLVVSTIQIISQRGAFKAEELSTVGGLYERLVAFLKANGAIREANAEQPATEAETETEK
jgi:hypothetical protein